MYTRTHLSLFMAHSMAGTIKKIQKSRQIVIENKIKMKSDTRPVSIKLWSPFESNQGRIQDNI